MRYNLKFRIWLSTARLGPNLWENETILWANDFK